MVQEKNNVKTAISERRTILLNEVIPEQLRNEKFRFCLVKHKTKKPFESNWQTTINYRFDNKRLLDHLRLNGNYGIVCGFGDLRILDIDDEDLGRELEKKINTFVVKTGNNGRHFYFISDYDKNHVLKEELGELRANHEQVIGANCLHENGNQYEVIKDVEILKISKEDLLEIIKPYLREEVNKVSTDNFKDKPKDETRSGREYREVIKLISKGLSQEEVFRDMEAFSKWSTAPEQYKQLTYEKALSYVESKTKKVLDLESISFKDLINSDVERPSWLIDGLILKHGLTFLGGDYGTNKTWQALNIAVCLSTGQDLFNEFKTKKGRVLVIDEENRIFTLKERCRLLANGLGLKPENVDINFLIDKGVLLDNETSFKQFDKLIDKLNPDLIIVDSLVRCMEGDENNVKDVKKIFNNLKKFLNKTAFLILHHTRKPYANPFTRAVNRTDLRGSSDFGASPDVILMLNPFGDDNRFKISIEKDRISRIRKKDFVVLNNSDDDMFRVEFEKYLEPSEQKEKIPKSIQRANLIKNWLENLSELEKADIKTKDIKEAFTDFSKTDISGAIGELELEGVIERLSKKGHYRAL